MDHVVLLLAISLHHECLVLVEGDEVSVDIPRAWQISDMTPREYHHNKCSYNTHLMLCDCDVLFKHPEQLSDNFYGKDGVIIKRAQP